MTIGIGYTLYDFNEKTREKKPLSMVKGRPGNLFEELKRIQEKAKEINRLNLSSLKSVFLWTGVYAFTIKAMIIII